ncbi:MAG: ketoacyl-ACP synthase III [Acidobacteria bacterium]|nr:MAG: ketoacyl-ACP synthase III [Acidobacteriota bacterium]
MSVKRRAQIVGTGAALPARVVTNADLEKMVDTTDEWITTRTGIKERRIACSDEYLSQFASPAARQALERAEIEPDQVDLILCATVTPDMITPATACFIQEDLKAKNAAAFDLSAGCSGFLYALTTGQTFIEAGHARTVLVIGGEILSRFINWDDRSTCVIFADGAGALVLRAGEGERGVLASRMHSDGALADFITIAGGGSRYPITPESLERKVNTIKMRGNETFKVAVRSIEDVSREVIEAAGLTPDQIDLFVPHQANRRIIDAVAQRLGLDAERCYLNIEKTGNTSAASIPIALNDVVEAGRLRPDDHLLMAAFGAGLTWAGAVVRWGRDT